jgi:hypothetical protein
MGWWDVRSVYVLHAACHTACSLHVTLLDVFCIISRLLLLLLLHFAAYTLVAALVTLLLLYNLSSYTSSHRRTRLLLAPASQFTASSSSISNSAPSSSKAGGIAQQLLSQLSKGPTGDLLQQYILPLTNFSSLSAAQLPLLLQGTNFTTLSTAAVLDAAGSRLNSQQKWQLAHLHQSLFCA